MDSSANSLHPRPGGGQKPSLKQGMGSTGLAPAIRVALQFYRQALHMRKMVTRCLCQQPLIFMFDEEGPHGVLSPDCRLGGALPCGLRKV